MTLSIPRIGLNPLGFSRYGVSKKDEVLMDVTLRDINATMALRYTVKGLKTSRVGGERIFAHFTQMLYMVPFCHLCPHVSSPSA